MNNRPEVEFHHSYRTTEQSCFVHNREIYKTLFMYNTSSSNKRPTFICGFVMIAVFALGYDVLVTRVFAIWERFRII